MSERLGLGVADGESRWIGVRRHQAGLVIAGAGLVGEWITQVHGVLIELVVGLTLLSCAVPTPNALTVGERVRIGVDYLVRSRWTSVHVTRRGDVVTIVARVAAVVRGFELQHRGRLDLSGRGQHNALALEEFADALATSDVTRHFSLHVRTSPDQVATLLAVPTDVSAPVGWTENAALALDVATTGEGAGVAWWLERWTYVRHARGVTRVLRVRDFSAVPDGRALLERLQFASSTLDVTVHVDVVGGDRAQRLAARAVHRVGSDEVTSRAAGFRRTAQSTRALERLRQRESMVAEGTALLRIAVFVAVRAASPQLLRHDVKAVTRAAFESGLRCEPGFGRQAPWYRAQLPGAPGW